MDPRVEMDGDTISIKPICGPRGQPLSLPPLVLAPILLLYEYSIALARMCCHILYVAENSSMACDYRP
jgi:hypothetical protein